MRYPSGLPETVRTDWSDLHAATGAPARFDPDKTTTLPDPVRRWLAHAVAPETPLLTGVELTTHGQIRLDTWREFTATHRLSVDRGFVWAGTSTRFGLPVVGFDRYTRLAGEVSWKMFTRFAVNSAHGPDATRSAAGRHAGELLVAAPAIALSRRVTWHAIDDEQATARIRVDNAHHDVRLTVAADGTLTSMAMSRWGKGEDGAFRVRPFGADFAGESTFGGFTIPSTVVAGWDHGAAGWDQGQVLRYTVDAATYR